MHAVVLGAVAASQGDADAGRLLNRVESADPDSSRLILSLCLRCECIVSYLG